MTPDARRMSKHGTPRPIGRNVLRDDERTYTADDTFPGCTITGDDLEFIKACERYQRENRRPFPTFTEILRVAKALGYRKVDVDVAEPTVIGE